MIDGRMHRTRPHILFIPGLGDRAWLYRLSTPIWRVFGYATHVHLFGWNRGAEDLVEKQARLLSHVDTLPGDHLYVIGISAGGTAAVNLLAQRPAIRKVITVASPLKPKDHPTNSYLTASIAQADEILVNADQNFKQKILSVHGLYDRTVPITKSRLPGIHLTSIFALGHGLTIFLALTAFSGALRRFLRLGEPVSRPAPVTYSHSPSTSARRRFCQAANSSCCKARRLWAAHRGT